MTTDVVGVVLAAGKGTRMRSKTPKTLHAVCGSPMLWHVAKAMRDAGIARIVAVASPALHGDPRFAEAAGPDAHIAVQKEQLGTADALLAAMNASAGAKHVAVGAGDMPLVRADTVSRLVAAHVSARALATVLYSSSAPVAGMGRVKMDGQGAPVAVIEENEATPEELAIRNVNTSWYCFDSAWLWRVLPTIRQRGKREAYLTDLVELAAQDGRSAGVEVSEPIEALGVNDRAQLARAETAMRERIRSHWMAAGVTLKDPATTYIDAEVVIGADTVIYPAVHLRGKSIIGVDCEIGPGGIITDCVIGDRSKVIASFCDGAQIGSDVSVGPSSRLRAETVVEDGAYIGNFAEVKNSRVGRGTHFGHFSYVGDSTLGRDVNIGAGTVTCNFDGVRKHETHIGDGASIGSGTMLIAPRRVGARAGTGAGSVVTHDIPDGEVHVGNPARPINSPKSPRDTKAGSSR